MNFFLNLPKPPDLLPFSHCPSLLSSLSASSLTQFCKDPLRAHHKTTYDSARYGFWPVSASALPPLRCRSAFLCALCGWFSRSFGSTSWDMAFVIALRVWAPTDLHYCDCPVRRPVSFDGMLWSLPHLFFPLSGKSSFLAAQGCGRYCAGYGCLLVSVVFVRSSATCVFLRHFCVYICSACGFPLLKCVYLLSLDFGLWCQSPLCLWCEFYSVFLMSPPPHSPLPSSDVLSTVTSPNPPLSPNHLLWPRIPLLLLLPLLRVVFLVSPTLFVVELLIKVLVSIYPRPSPWMSPPTSLPCLVWGINLRILL